MDFLYLSEKDMIQAGVKDMERCLESIEYMFKLLNIGDYRMGGNNNSDHGLRVMFPQNSDIPNMPLAAPGRWFATMPAYLGGKYHVFGIKSYGANQDNYKADLPRSILMMSLLDIDSGAPLAYMSANILSAMRTGAVSGLYAKYFVSRKAKKIAIIGPGTMARYSIDGIMKFCPEIEEISVFGRGNKNKELFKMHCDQKGYRYKIYNNCATIEEACKNADIILTANTQAEKYEDYPLIKGACIKKGACIIVVSAVRLERSYLETSTDNTVFVADDIRMYLENRRIDVQPQTEEDKKTVTVKGAIHEQLCTGAKVLNFPEIVGHENCYDKSKTYICASGGMPIEDVAWGYECYEKALKLNIGTKLSLWEKPSL